MFTGSPPSVTVLAAIFGSLIGGLTSGLSTWITQRWLETVCDYVFYFFLLTGMVIGQWRSSGSSTYLVWGGLLLVGAVVSFLAVGWQRINSLPGGRSSF